MVNLLSLTSSPSSSILRGRTLSEYIPPLLRADAKTYTTAEEFIKRNSTFFTSKLDRPPYMPTTSPSSTEAATVPMQALHTAAAALTLVPPSHWTVETHRANIASYDGSDTVTIPAENADGVNPDKLFKKELYHYLRWALSASAPGPGIPEIMTILGREETVRRIQDAKALTQSLVPQTGRRVPKGEKKLQEDRSWMGTLAPQK
jgi:glutamyl-tRNA synthetase